MRNIIMEALETRLDANVLATIVKLPNSYMGRELRVVISPVEDKEPGILDKLCGIASNLNMSSEDIRDERLREKYGTIY